MGAKLRAIIRLSYKKIVSYSCENILPGRYFTKIVLLPSN